jgi:hypothetical protein
MKQIQYIIDGQGNKTAAIIPFQDWEMLTEKYSKLQAKIDVFSGIRDSLQEIRQAKQNGETLQSLDEFLHESGY